MFEGDKVAQVRLIPGEIAQASFEVGGEAIEAEIMTPEEGYEAHPDYVPAVQVTEDAAGNKVRRFLRLPHRLHENQPAEVSFFESHEALIKGAIGGGAVLILGGLVAANSLRVRRTNK